MSNLRGQCYNLSINMSAYINAVLYTKITHFGILRGYPITSISGNVY